MAVTNGHGADLVINTVGGTVFAESVSCMAFEGRLAMVGYVDNTLTAPIDLQALHAKRLKLFGVSNKLRSPDQRAQFLPEFKRDIIPLLADGRIKPLVDAVFPFNELEQAKQMMETNTHVGKIVIKIEDNDN
jgi:NADPH:quinone reductase-like Zn-dependent oxidoreductase